MEQGTEITAGNLCCSPTSTPMESVRKEIAALATNRLVDKRRIQAGKIFDGFAKFLFRISLPARFIEMVVAISFDLKGFFE